MRTIFTIISLLIFNFQSIYAQDAKGKSIFNQISTQETTTVIVNIASYNMEIAGTLKDKLLAYPEKVTEVKFNTKQTALLITYNGNMLREDFIRAFEESGISHRVEDNTTSINSSFESK
jgi:hypothetical protein